MGGVDFAVCEVAMWGVQVVSLLGMGDAVKGDDDRKGVVAFYDTKPYDREYFGACGKDLDLEMRFFEFRLSKESAASAEGCDVVCVFVNDRLDAGVLQALSERGVRMVALRCAGFNQLDQDEAKKLGMKVVRVPAYSPHAVAEHAIGLLLTLNRKIHRAYNRVRELNFSLGGLVGFDLYRKTVGVMGTGRIGQATAEIFRGFGCEVLAYDPRPDDDWAAGAGVRYVGAKELLKASHVVSLHMPLTEETYHFIDEEAVRGMKRGAYLVNPSRGKLVDSAAVIAGLKSRHLGGVALDVYEEEEGVFFEDLSDAPLQDDMLSRLLTFPNVLITSHQAFLTEEALTEIAETTLDSISKFLRGEEIEDERVVCR